MLKKIFATGLAVLSLNSFSDAGKLTLEQHWDATQLKFEQLIYGEINDLSCLKNERYFLGCLTAINESYQLTDPGFRYYFFPSQNTDSPLQGFTLSKLEADHKDVKARTLKYNADALALYKELTGAGPIKFPLQFSSATAKIGKTVQGTTKEAFFTGLVYNAFLSTVLDPHSYISPTSYLREQSGKSEAVKAYGMMYKPTTFNDEEKLVVISTEKNSPAMKAGLEPGDVILDINGKKTPLEMVREISTDTATLTIEGSSGSRVVSMQRAELERSQLETRIITDHKGKHFGYMKLKSFMVNSTCEDMYAAGSDFRDQGVDGIILDLRNNGGGNIEVAKCIMKFYLEEGSINWVEKTLNTPTPQIKVSKVKDAISLFNDLHTVTLINGHSASASEATASYLQAYRKSFIVGERSFGKGTMQMLRPSGPTDNINNPKLTIAATVAKYYGPHLVSPQLQGVTPEFKVLPEYGQKEATPYKREEDLFENAIVNAPVRVPVLPGRIEDLKKIMECLKEENQTAKDFEALDSFKQRVFDQQLSAAQAVIDCANEKEIAIFSDINIPRVNAID